MYAYIYRHGPLRSNWALDADGKKNIYLEYSEILFLKIAVAFGWSKILRVVGDLFWGDVSVASFSSNAKPNHPGHAELCGTTLCLVDCGNKLGCAGHGSNCFLKSYGALVWRFTKNGKNTQKLQHPTTKKDEAGKSGSIIFYLKDRSRV